MAGLPWWLVLPLGYVNLCSKVLAFWGAIADRFGAKPLIIIGMLLRAAGFVLMALAYDPWVLWLSCVLSALGGTLFDPPRTALVIKLTRPYERGRFYSLLFMQDSAGAVIGALIGSWLLQYDFHYVCWAGAAVFVIAALLMLGCCLLIAFLRLKPLFVMVCTES